MSQQVIYVGSSPNDGNGDNLRAAFTKCNDNFTELFGGTVIADTSPQLGGNLDVNDFNIISSGGGDINILPSGMLTLADLTLQGTLFGTVYPGADISLATTGTGYVNINNINSTGGKINNTVIGGSNPTAATFTTVVSTNHTPTFDATYTLGTASKRWSALHSSEINIGKIVLNNAQSVSTTQTLAVTNRSFIKLNTTAGAIAVALSDSGVADGQQVTFAMIVSGGDAVITPTAATTAGFTYITFSNVGSTATLIYVNAKWMIKSVFGAIVN
jgi:hypothetical protein